MFDGFIPNLFHAGCGSDPLVPTQWSTLSGFITAAGQSGALGAPNEAQAETHALTNLRVRRGSVGATRGADSACARRRALGALGSLGQPSAAPRTPEIPI